LANKQAKAPLIDDLADRLSRSSIAILTDYRGLSVADLTDLRRKLRAADVDYQVTKNTLTRFAAERVNKAAINQDLEGPTAIAFGYDDPAVAAKVVQDYLRTSRVLRVKSAVYGDRRLAPQEVQALAELPPKPQLQARLVGTVQGPMSSLVGTINALLSQLAYVLDQRAQQLGGAGAARAATE
jgi:large subunit ribosomal protein L10